MLLHTLIPNQHAVYQCVCPSPVHKDPICKSNFLSELDGGNKNYHGSIPSSDMEAFRDYGVRGVQVCPFVDLISGSPRRAGTPSSKKVSRGKPY
jgi:hypothetical protein